MGEKIKLVLDKLEIYAELNDTIEARQFAHLLPLDIALSRWGDEYYGSCQLKQALGKDTREQMEIGELAFWPPGNAFCIFFGRTPASTDDKPRAASSVNPLGKLHGDTNRLKNLGNTVKAKISVAE